MKNQRFISNLIPVFFLSILIINLIAESDAFESSDDHHHGGGGGVRELHVGVILDTESWLGKIIHSCISMAVSDFYALNGHYYKTRIVLHTRDSKGDPLRALSAALDLLENIKAQAIIGPETLPEAKFLATLGDKAKVPILSLTPNSLSSTEHPYFLQITQSETTQFEGIATLVESYRWRDVVLIFEDIDYEREIIPYILNSFQEKNIRIAYKSAVSLLATEGQILEELHKIMMMQNTIFVLHVSPSLASRILLSARRLEMMREGYVWIITDKTLNLLHSMDPSVIEAMEGALGFKSYIPSSSKLQNFTRRWRKKLIMVEPDIEVMNLNVLGIWAYDTVCALAMAIESVGFEIPQSKEEGNGLDLMDLASIRASQIGPTLLNQILKLRFRGLSSDFQLVNGKLFYEIYEVVNILGKGERRVGFWTLKDRIVKEISPHVKYTSSNRDLEAIIWPGGSTTTPKGLLVRKSGKKLRIGVPVKRGFHELVNVDYDPQTNETRVTGFCVDVFKAAIDVLQYEVLLEFIPFIDGNGRPAGNYNNLVYQVYLESYDAAVGDISITSNRSLYVDFTLPYTDLGVGMVTKKENKNMWIFFKPLDLSLWLMSAGFFMVTGFVIWLFEHPLNEEFQGSPSQQIGIVFSTLVFAHSERLLSNFSKFLMIVWVFVVFILTSSYTATLSSLLTVQQIQLASKGNYIGYQGGFFVNGDVVSHLNLENPRVQYFTTKEYAEALSKGEKNGGVVAIVDEIPYIKIFLAKYSADYAMIASGSSTNGFAFVFPKGSPLVAEISRAIAKLRESGKLLKMEQTWFKSSQSSFMSYDSTTTNPETLSLNSFRGLFLVIGISLAVALFMFLIYTSYEKLCAEICNFPNAVRGILDFMAKYYLFIRNNRMVHTFTRLSM